MQTEAEPGGLIGIFRKNREEELRLLILGLDYSGKTTILKLLTKDHICNHTPTLGFNIKTLNHNKLIVNAWDTGEQMPSRVHQRHYLANTAGLVYVIDSADVCRLTEAAEQLERLLQEEELVGVPVLILANKQDLKQALSAQEILNKIKIDVLNHRTWTIAACSAKTQEGIEEGLTWLLQNLKK